LGSRNVSFSSGVLTITNNTLAATTINITQTASNKFTLTGNASGNFTGVTYINYTGSNGNDTVLLDLGGFTYGGQALFNTNGGADNVTIRNGTMQGNLNVLTGLGDDTVSLALGAGDLTLQGNVQISDTYGTNSLSMAQNGTVTWAGT